MTSAKCVSSGCESRPFRGRLCRPCFEASGFACRAPGCAGWIRGAAYCAEHGCSICGGRLSGAQRNQGGLCPPCARGYAEKLRGLFGAAAQNAQGGSR